MSITSGIIFGLSVTCFSMFYLSNSLILDFSKKKDVRFYANIVLKIFFMQIGILLIPTILSTGVIFLQDIGTMPASLSITNKLAGFAWNIYYIYLAIYSLVLIFGIFKPLIEGEKNWKKIE